MYGTLIAPAEVMQDGAITFERAVQEFRFGAAITELKKSTLHSYNEIIESILMPRFAKVRIKALDYAEAVQLDAEIKGRGCGQSRRRNVQIVLRTILRVAYDGGRLKEVPRFPPLPKVGRTVLTVTLSNCVCMAVAGAYRDDRARGKRDSSVGDDRSEKGANHF